MKTCTAAILAIATAALGTRPLAGVEEGQPPVDFSREVRPLLSDKCFACHGPDSAERKAGLRLDTREGALGKLRGGGRAVVPGDPAKSELVARIRSADPEERMPPPESHQELSVDEIDRLVRWVAAGAPWEEHWAFVPPVKRRPPAVENTRWPRGPLDRFVLARLEAEGLSPSPEASRETLIRRLSLDLRGIPPTPGEIDAFLRDRSPEAYERLVDRYLASVHTAERLALDWLDAARYADTNGYSIDDHREMWAWRDWAIHAFERNLTYDRFITEQLAGDLLPGATPDQVAATGFLRNSMNTHEGGTIAEEYRVAYVADKVDTVATALMGLTLKCGQCHDHKYDPLSQREYYQFFAFFNTTDEPGQGPGAGGNARPVLDFESPYLPGEALAQRAQERRELLEKHHAEGTKSFKKELDYFGGVAGSGRTSVMVMNYRPRPTHILERGAYDQPRERVEAGVPAVFPPLPPRPGVPEKPADPAPEIRPWDGASWIWDVADAAAREQPNEPRYFRFNLELPAAPARAELHVTVDNRVEVHANGQRLGSSEPWMKPGRFDLTTTLSAGANVIALRAENAGGVAGALAWLRVDLPSGKRVVHGTDASWRVATAAPDGWDGAGFDDGGWDVAKVLGPPSMGPWKIGAGAAAGGSPPAPEGPSRLDLAHWLTLPEHPLTARVAVDRYWRLVFGHGLVRTPEDFGAQGEPPTHPELLDWLAVAFVQSGWDVRALLRALVTSSTYRQRSDFTPERLRRDPENRLLARASRPRLPAELLRDNVLSIAGLLSPEVGGPGVYPYQPPGLWKEVSHYGPHAFTAMAYYTGRGQDHRRRSLYTFWKRTCPPPEMMVLDAPTRETCTVRRQTTNTPLQALVLLNGTAYVEAARALAARMLTEAPGRGDRARLSHGFRLATARLPEPRELALLERALARQRAVYARHPERAAPLLSVGELPPAEGLDPAEHAAFTLVANIILNLDETMTRP